MALVTFFLVACVAWFVGTRLVTTELFCASPILYDYYFRLYLPTFDLLYSAIKVAIFAIEVGLIHGYFGYYATGGHAGEGAGVRVANRIPIVVVHPTHLLLPYPFLGNTTPVSLPRVNNDKPDCRNRGSE